MEYTSTPTLQLKGFMMSSTHSPPGDPVDTSKDLDEPPLTDAEELMVHNMANATDKYEAASAVQPEVAGPNSERQTSNEVSGGRRTGFYDEEYVDGRRSPPDSGSISPWPPRPPTPRHEPESPPASSTSPNHPHPDISYGEARPTRRARLTTVDSTPITGPAAQDQVASASFARFDPLGVTTMEVDFESPAEIDRLMENIGLIYVGFGEVFA